MTERNLGPVPSRLVLLADLPSVAFGEKIRFLGCVSKYSISTGTLSLIYGHADNTPVPCVAHVDVRLLLSSLKSTDTEVGEWVNVIGYIAVPPRTMKKSTMAMQRAQHVNVQAIMLWSAGAIKIDDYERTLEQRLEMAKH
ncbi:MAG: hypothetical protein M1819_004739 [Sarea resinae]|nr:MAG: hypothetical protein M1819_004739 [Sarea resinae]